MLNNYSFIPEAQTWALNINQDLFFSEGVNSQNIQNWTNLVTSSQK